MILLPQKVAYRGTVTGLRISGINGGAFIDNVDIAVLPQNGKVVVAETAIAANAALLDTTTANAFYGGAVDLTAYQTGNYAIRFKNTATGAAAEAYISATAPSGEALSDEILDAWVNHPSLPFETFTVAGSDITQAVNTTGYGLAYKVLSSPSGKLYKVVSAVYTLNSGTAPLFGIANSGAEIISSLVKGATTYVTGLSTAYDLLIQSNSTTATDFALTGTSVKQLTMPVATGALLLSTKGGSRGWYRKDAAFDPNAAMTYEILDCSLSAFTDGLYSIEIYDASGRMLRGYLGAAGTGETLGGELVDAWTNNATYPYETWTPGAGNLITQAVNGAVGLGIGYKTLASSYRLSLLKSTNAVALSSGTLPSFKTSSTANSDATTMFDTNATSYRTVKSTDSYLLFINSNAADFALTTYTIQQVLTPSANGATIVTAKGGTTQSFSVKDASFTYNAATNYVIVRKAR